MSFGKFTFGVPGVFKLLMGSKGFPIDAGGKDADSVELTDEAARVYVLTMLAVGAGNSHSAAPWGPNW